MVDNILNICIELKIFYRDTGGLKAFTKVALFD